MSEKENRSSGIHPGYVYIFDVETKLETDTCEPQSLVKVAHLERMRCCGEGVLAACPSNTGSVQEIVGTVERRTRSAPWHLAIRKSHGPNRFAASLHFPSRHL